MSLIEELNAKLTALAEFVSAPINPLVKPLEEVLRSPLVFYPLLALMVVAYFFMVRNLFRLISKQLQGAREVRKYKQAREQELERLDRKIALASLLLADEKDSTK